MKKLFLLLLLLPSLVWADFGTSMDGKETSVTCTHTSACDSAWVVFGYDGDAGGVDTANMYDSLRVLPCFSGNGKTLCGDGLDLDSIGTHVVKIYYFSGDAITDVQVGIWEHKAATGDSLNTLMGDVDAVKAKTDNLPADPADDSDMDEQIEAIAMYWGAKGDGYYQILYPADGSASKDSVGIFDDGDTHKATIYFHHSNVEAVVDSITFRKW